MKRNAGQSSRLNSAEGGSPIGLDSARADGTPALSCSNLESRLSHSGETSRNVCRASFPIRLPRLIPALDHNTGGRIGAEESKSSYSSGLGLGATAVRPTFLRCSADFLKDRDELERMHNSGPNGPNHQYP